MMYEVSPSAASTASLEDYLESVKARKLLVLALALIGLVLGYFLASNRSFVYEAEATVVVNPTPVGADTSNRLVTPNLERESSVIVSDDNARAAVALLGDTDDQPLALRNDIAAEYVPNSDIIKLTYSASDPARAASVVNAFATAYVEGRVAAQDMFYTDQVAGLSTAIAQLETERNEIEGKLSEVDAERSQIASNSVLDAVDRSEQLGQTASERAVLVTERNTIASAIRGQSAALTQLESTSVVATPAAALLSEALPSSAPTGLPTSIFTVAGLLIGFLLGVAIAFLMHRLDRSASNADEVTAVLGAPVIGVTPDLGWRHRKGTAAIAMLSPQKSHRIHDARESYRRLRTAVEFLMKSEGISSVLITSSHPGEGKSVTSTNLAIALSAGGSSVALINADMRRPTLEQLLGASNGDRGLSTYLGGIDAEVEHKNFDNIPQLALVPAGPIPANPGELLASPRFDQLLGEIGKQVDLALVDTPPVGSTADSTAAAKSVDGVIVIVDSKNTSLDELRLTRADLDRAGARILGAVINRASTHEGGFLGARRKYSSYSYAKS